MNVPGFDVLPARFFRKSERLSNEELREVVERAIQKRSRQSRLDWFSAYLHIEHILCGWNVEEI